MELFYLEAASRLIGAVLSNPEIRAELEDAVGGTETEVDDVLLDLSVAMFTGAIRQQKKQSNGEE